MGRLCPQCRKLRLVKSDRKLNDSRADCDVAELHHIYCPQRQGTKFEKGVWKAAITRYINARRKGANYHYGRDCAYHGQQPHVVEDVRDVFIIRADEHEPGFELMWLLCDDCWSAAAESVAVPLTTYGNRPWESYGWCLD